MKQEFINVNGKAYDPVTGLPLPISVATSPTVAPTQPKRVVKASTARGTTTATIHRVPVQKSATLSRRHIKRPPQKSLATRPVRTPSVTVQQHVAVKKFSPQITQKPAVEAPKKPVQIDRPAEVHPVVQRAKQRQIAKAPQFRKPSQSQHQFSKMRPSAKPWLKLKSQNQRSITAPSASKAN